MADKSKFSLFGFRLNRNKEETVSETIPSFTVPPNEDGATTISSSAFYSQTLDLDGVVKNEVELITRYREMAMQPEIESAIEDIINEAIVQDDDGQCVDIVTDKLDVSDKLKKAIEEEFDNVLTLLNFKNMGSDIFRRYYVDGRLNYHVIIDNTNPKNGIRELRYIDPRKIKKIREVKKQKDPDTGISIITGVDEYYVYNDKMVAGTTASSGIEGIKIAVDSVINITSGLMDARRAVVLSYLHKCLEGNQRVRTNSGWKYVKDIISGDVVYSYNIENSVFEETVVKNQWKTGNRDVIEIKTKHTSLICTKDHPILVKNVKTESIEYINAGELIPTKHKIRLSCEQNLENKIPFPELDRKIVCKVSNPENWIEYDVKSKKQFIYEIADKFNQNRTRVYSFIYGYQPLEKELAENIIKEFPIELQLTEKYEGWCVNQLELPEFIDSDFAKLFGYLLGDGWVNTNTIGVSEGVYEELNVYYKELMVRYFGNCNRIVANGRKSKYHSYYTNNTLGCELLKKMGFLTGASVKRIPEWVYSAAKEIQLSFIEGLHDADGCDRSDKFGNIWASTFNLANQKLIYDIKELWTRLGYCSGTIGTLKQKPTTINGVEVKKFAGAWSVTLSKKPLPEWENVVRLNSISDPTDVYDIEVESSNHNFVVNGLIAHNCIKPLNQLRMIEDASIIYKISRAPSRRIFYVDVGDMPKAKAEQYLRDMMAKYKNKIVYDAQTGQVRDDRRHLSILEDFWMPRRSNGNTTEIKTLESADNFSNMDMVEYFEQKLYKSLNVPVSRIDSQSAYNIGRSAEISREEIKFAKFIDKLRRKFSAVFDQIMRIQLVLKGICTLDEWEEYKEELYYDFIKDNNYTELKEAELMQGRLGILAIIDPYTGKYFSKEWIQRNVLRLNDDVILDMEKEIKKEKEEDLKQQQEDQKNQIVLQAQGLELQNQLMPQPDQQIDAGAEPEQQEEPPAPKKSANPYQI